MGEYLLRGASGGNAVKRGRVLGAIALAVAAAALATATGMGGVFHRPGALATVHHATREELRARAVDALAEAGGAEVLGRETAALLRELRDHPERSSIVLVPAEMLDYDKSGLILTVDMAQAPALAAVNERLWREDGAPQLVSIERDGAEPCGRLPAGAPGHAEIVFGNHRNYGRLFVFDPADMPPPSGNPALEQLEGPVFFHCPVPLE